MSKYTAFKQGFTLVEIMVALMIFSIGLLGLAGLQILGSQLSADSYLRAIAVIQANDIIDRMRANSSDTNLGTASGYNNPSGVGTQNTNCLKTAGCTPAQMAGEDLYEWYNNIAAVLPSGRAIVCIDSTAVDGSPSDFACDNAIAVSGKPIFAIKIFWVERKDSSSATTIYHNYTSSFSL